MEKEENKKCEIRPDIIPWDSNTTIAFCYETGQLLDKYVALHDKGISTWIFSQMVGILRENGIMPIRGEKEHVKNYIVRPDGRRELVDY